MGSHEDVQPLSGDGAKSPDPEGRPRYRFQRVGIRGQMSRTQHFHG